MILFIKKSNNLILTLFYCYMKIMKLILSIDIKYMIYQIKSIHKLDAKYNISGKLF